MKPPPRSPTPPTDHADVICAAGGLVWRPSMRSDELAVIFRERYGPEWCLPKGKLNPGESWKGAAVREVGEETGCEVRLLGFAGGVCYLVGDRPKIVLYWNMQLLRETPFAPTDEVRALRWVSRSAALRLLDHARERMLVRASRAWREG